MRKLPLSLRQKLALFWQRIDRFWRFLALGAAVAVLGSVSGLFFTPILRTIFRFFDIDLLSGVESGMMGGLMAGIIAIYMKGLDFKKPTQPFKLRQLVLPKKFYSPKMWVTEAPYTAVFIFFVALWLVFYGWNFWQFNLSPREIFIACLTLALLSAVYVLCVLAQGYRDFFNDDEPALEEVRKQ